LIEVLRQLSASGIGLLLIKQNVAVATAVAERVLVMVNGTVALEAASATLAGDEAMQRRYRGVATVAH